MRGRRPPLDWRFGMSDADRPIEVTYVVDGETFSANLDGAQTARLLAGNTTAFDNALKNQYRHAAKDLRQQLQEMREVTNAKCADIICSITGQLYDQELVDDLRMFLKNKTQNRRSIFLRKGELNDAYEKMEKLVKEFKEEN